MDGGIGHNSGSIADRHAELVARKDELLAAMARVPAVVDSDETSGRVADFIKQLIACQKQLDAAKEVEKRPIIEEGKRIDGFFNQCKAEIDGAKSDLISRNTAYHLKKEAEERARLKAEAEALAAQAKDEATLDQAIKIDEAANAKAKELTRVTSSYGTTVSLRSEWTFRNLDRAKIDLEKLRPYLPLEGIEKAIRAAIKAGERTIAGVEVYENKVAR